MKTRAVVHFHQMRQFMMHDMVLQMAGQQQQVKAEADVLLLAAASPPAFGLADAKIIITKS